MATESPIRISEAADRWPAGKQSTSYRPSSAEMAMEDLGLFLKDQWFQNHEKDVMPSRCESAPPSMEGSTAAIGTISLHQRSATNPAMKYPNISAHNHEDPPSSSYHGTDVNPNQRFVEHFSSWNRYQPTGTGKIRNTTDAKFANNCLQLTRNSLPAHEEESEDEIFEQSAAGKAAFLGYHNRSLGSMQEDIYHAPSTSQDQSHSLGHKSSEKAVVSDSESGIQHKNSTSISAADTDNPCLDDMRQTLLLDGLRGINDQDINATKADAEDNHSTAGVADVHSIHIEAMKTANLLTALDLASQKLYKKDQLAPQNEVLQHQVAPQESNTSQVQGSYPHIIYPGINHMYGSLNQFQYGSTSVSTAEIQPTLQSSGFTPPLYATQAVFMTSPSPCYPNMYPAGFYSPRYSVSGYNSNSTVPPSYLAGYPYEGVVPPVLNGTPLSPAGVSNGGSAHAFDLQNHQKYYSQIGLGMQPSYHMQYIQPPLRDPYAAYSNFVHQTPRYGAAVNQVGSRAPKKGAEHVGSSNDHKIPHLGATGYNNMNLKTMNVASHYYLGRPTNAGPPVQFPAASAVNPVTRAKPGPGNNFVAGSYNMSLPHSYSGSSSKADIQSQTWTGMNSYSLLEELKSGEGQRFELSDIAGRIVGFSIDQHGSRFIQQKLETCSVEEKTSVFKEVVPHASKLITDVFGNYVIQKLFEYGNPEQRKYLATQLEGQILPLSLQMYGCRVIQKALDVIDLEQKVRLVGELDGHVLRCVRDQNGNHVIQKCIESIPADSIHFIISSFCGQVTMLSMHPYGCRVIQRVLEHCNDQIQTRFIVDEILESVLSLAQDQYGNYVTQHVLARWKPRERHEIIEKLSGSMVQLSQHKFASNVVEKCLQYSDPVTREKLIKEIIGHGEKNDNLLIMMKDQYANYVIQKILDICSPNQREMLLGLVKDHLPALKKYTYGKHIAARFEQLYDIQTLGA